MRSSVLTLIAWEGGGKIEICFNLQQAGGIKQGEALAGSGAISCRGFCPQGGGLNWLQVVVTGGKGVRC